MVNSGICEKLLNHATDMLCVIDSEGRFVKVNMAGQRLLGYQNNEIIGHFYTEFIHPDDLNITRQAVIDIRNGKIINNFENRYIRKDKRVIPFIWSVSWVEEDGMFYCTVRDATERYNLHRKVNEKDAFYEALIEHGSDMLGLLDESGNYLYISGATSKILGYSTEQLIGLNAFSLIHPDDLASVVDSWSNLENQPFIQPSEFRFKAVDGTWRWIETIVSDQLHNPAIRAYVVSSRDITDRKMSRLRLEENEQRYRALFENNPDIVIFENTSGKITQVNPAFTETFGPDSEQFIGKSASSFLSPGMAAVNEQSLQEALLGSTLRYDLELISPNNQTRILDTVKFPVTVGGIVVGAQTISKDITPIVRSFETIERQAKKLNTIFESITDAFFTLDKNWYYTYVNSEFERITGTREEEYVGKHILDISEYGAEGPFYQQYKQAVDTGYSVHFEAYSRRLDKWLEVKAFPSEEGLSVYFTDVTEKVKAQKEVEKLSLVASNTTNGVIISDSKRRIEWVNEGFTRVTGYSLEEAVGKRPSELLRTVNINDNAFRDIQAKMESGLPVSFETLNYKKDGNQVWFSIQVNPIFNPQEELTGFVTLQTDITERVKVQQELEKLSLVASNTDNGVIITDANGLTEWVNEGFTRMTGYTLRDIEGIKPGSLLQGPESDKITIAEIGKNLKEGKPFNTTLINYRKSGEKFWVSMDINPIVNDNGIITQYIAIQKDITYRKEAEASMLSLTEDLYKQNSNLQEFTYIVSHNLRAPVANALGLANLLTKSPKDSPTFDESLTYLKTSILTMDTVLKDVNMILTVRDKQAVMNLEDVKLADVFWQAYVHFQEPYVKCGSEISFELPDDVTVKANKAYLFSIFYNLLSNAIKYRSAERALRIRVGQHYTPDGSLVITFSDNGTGFDTKKAGTDIFKLYKRFHKDKKGRGMGLFLVKAHVEAMGWKIEVNSRVNEGTTFLIYVIN